MTGRFRTLATLVALAAVGGVAQPALAANPQELDVKSLACVAYDVTLSAVTNVQVGCAATASTTAAPIGLGAGELDFGIGWFSGAACPDDNSVMSVFYHDTWGQMSALAAVPHWTTQVSVLGVETCVADIPAPLPGAWQVSGIGSYSGMSNLSPTFGFRATIPVHTISPISPTIALETSVAISVDNS